MRPAPFEGIPPPRPDHRLHRPLQLQSSPPCRVPASPNPTRAARIAAFLHPSLHPFYRASCELLLRLPASATDRWPECHRGVGTARGGPRRGQQGGATGGIRGGAGKPLVAAAGLERGGWGQKQGPTAWGTAAKGREAAVSKLGAEKGAERGRPPALQGSGGAGKRGGFSVRAWPVGRQRHWGRWASEERRRSACGLWAPSLIQTSCR